MDERVIKLLELQKTDTKIDRLQEEIDAIPAEIAIHEKEMDDLRNTYQEKKRNKETNDEEKTKTLADKQAMENRRTQIKTQLLDAKTNELYRAMQEQIKHATAKISDLDGVILDLMYKEDELLRVLDEAEQELEREKKRSEKRNAILQGQKAELEEKMESLLSDRQKASVCVDVRFRDKYERQRSSRRGQVVVPLKNGNCGGCHTNIPSQAGVEISQGETYVCPLCGCFVIWDDGSSFAG